MFVGGLGMRSLRFGRDDRGDIGLCIIGVDDVADGAAWD